MRRALCFAALLLVAGIAPASLGAAVSSIPARIVSLAPSVTETLFALGDGSGVVGVSSYCDRPPAATRLPKVGTFLTPNVEAIAALRPDLVIGPSLSSNQREFRALGAMGYSTMTISDDSLQAIEQTITAIGARTGRPEAARHLLDQIRTRINDVRDRLERTRPRTVVMLVGHDPMVAVGRGTYLDDLLRFAGGENIAAVSSQQWPQLSIEYILAIHPEVILDGSMGTDTAASAAFWSRYPGIPAVRDHRIHGYPQDPIFHPGPRVGESLETLAKLIHPEAFAAAAETSANATAPPGRQTELPRTGPK